MGGSVTDQASRKIKDQSISLKTSMSLGGVGGQKWGRGQNSRAAPCTEGQGAEKVSVCVYALKREWGAPPVWGLGPRHLSALAERRPGLESGSSAGMCVLPSEGEERGEKNGPADRERFPNTNTRKHA